MKVDVFLGYHDEPTPSILHRHEKKVVDDLELPCPKSSSPPQRKVAMIHVIDISHVLGVEVNHLGLPAAVVLFEVAWQNVRNERYRFSLLTVSVEVFLRPDLSKRCNGHSICVSANGVSLALNDSRFALIQIGGESLDQVVAGSVLQSEAEAAPSCSQVAGCIYTSKPGVGDEDLLWKGETSEM